MGEGAHAVGRSWPSCINCEQIVVSCCLLRLVRLSADFLAIINWHLQYSQCHITLRPQHLLSTGQATNAISALFKPRINAGSLIIIQTPDDNWVLLSFCARRTRDHNGKLNPSIKVYRSIQSMLINVHFPHSKRLSTETEKFMTIYSAPNYSIHERWDICKHQLFSDS